MITDIEPQDISRQIAVEESLLLALDGRNSAGPESTVKAHSRIRLDTLKALLAKTQEEEGAPAGRVSPSAAMDRIVAHFDVNAKGTPYVLYRGPTPATTPSLAKDIRTLFQFLAVKGLYVGDIPELDTRFHRV